MANFEACAQQLQTKMNTQIRESKTSVWILRKNKGMTVLIEHLLFSPFHFHPSTRWNKNFRQNGSSEKIASFFKPFSFSLSFIPDYQIE